MGFMMRKEIEILAPAGSYESLKAAIAAGADAVYIGGTRFGARAYADNLDKDRMLEVIDYVHLHGRKIYMTVNTLLKEAELRDELYEYLLPYYEHGLDAVIVQDLGVLKYIREQFPDLPIHASTQMTVNDVLGAKFLEKLGVERVVTSREMHIDEIRQISEQTDLEIESFVHGALCYCYSGQCLYSSLIGGRSGNRGQCAQPCRLPYKMNGEKKNQYILSLKDICTLEYIPEILEAGICSLKIEGRMKKPEYVALVTAMYRKYVDLYLQKGKAGFKVDPKDKEKLLDLYNRGGSHGGYYHTQNGRDMISIDRPNHAGVPALKVIKCAGKSVTAKALVDIQGGDVVEMPDQKENFTFSNGTKKGQTVTFTTHQKQNIYKDMILNRTRNESLIKEIQDSILNRKVKEKIQGKLLLSTETSAKLELSYKDKTVIVYGEKAEEAMNQPMDADRIEKQMRKTGNTEFEFDRLEVELVGNLFVPMQQINELRRNGLEALERSVLNDSRRVKGIEKSYAEYENDPVEQKELFSVYVEELEQFQVVVKDSSVKRIYIDSNAISKVWESDVLATCVEEAHKHEKEIYLALPNIFRSKTIEKFERGYQYILDSCIDGILIRNIESFEFLKNHAYDGNIVADHSVYEFNTYSKEFWKERELESHTASLELNYKELGEVGLENSELVVYGYLPMMVSAQCIQKTTAGCTKKSGRLSFKDRYNKEFTVKNNCDYCYNVIYNTSPLVLLDQKSEIIELSPKALRLQFTIERPVEVQKILAMYRDVFLNNKKVPELDMDFTRGHFKRGIK